MLGASLVRLMQQMVHEQSASATHVDLIFGTVSETSPLKIRIANTKLELSETFLVLSDMCREKTITVPSLVTDSNADNPDTSFEYAHRHKTLSQNVTLWRGLQVGDKVAMLRVHHGSLFYVLQRVEEEG